MKTTREKALPFVLLGVGLAGVLALGALLAPRPAPVATQSTSSAPAPSASAAPSDLSDLGVRDLSAVDPSDLLVRAKSRALAWEKDAILVAIRAEPVVGGKVNLTGGGAVELFFGKPTGEGFGAGARVGAKRFRIAVTAAGVSTGETPTGPARASLEPNCPLEEAARKAQASGLLPTAPLSVTYEMNDRYKKPTWRLRTGNTAADTRFLDGWSCAVLVR